MTIRDDLIAELQRVAGKDVHVIAYQDNADVLDRKTVMVKQRTIQPLPATPKSGLRIDYTLTFIAPALNPAIAEAQLDEWVPELLDDLRMNWFVWTEATKVLFSTTNLAYDVDAFVLTSAVNQSRKAAIK